MATSLTPFKRAQAFLTTTIVSSNAVLKSALVSVTQAFGATVNVKYSRTTSGSLAGATVFWIEGSADGTPGSWTPLYMWTTALHGVSANCTFLSSTKAAGSVVIDPVSAPTLALSGPIAIYNSATPANTEWNWLAGSLTTTNQALLNSTTYAQTGGVAAFVSQAETWMIPVDLTGVSNIRFVVHNLWNAVASNVVVKADLEINDAVLGT